MNYNSEDFGKKVDGTFDRVIKDKFGNALLHVKSEAQKWRDSREIVTPNLGKTQRRREENELDL